LTSSCLLGNSNYHARGLAETELEVVMLPPGTFRLLFDRLEGFRNHVFSKFSERMTEMLELVSAVAFQKLDQRLAAALVAKPSPVRTTHQALADELGSLREIARLDSAHGEAQGLHAGELEARGRRHHLGLGDRRRR
jgi:CRP/FNR family transcriptional regulator